MRRQLTTTILFFVALCLGLSFVSAATVSIHFPATDSIQNVNINSVDGGNITINASVDLGGDDLNVTTLNYSYRASSGADWIPIFFTGDLHGNATTNLTSNSGNHTYLFPWNITDLADGTAYELNVTAFNDTGVIGSTVATSIIIDKTNPVSKADVIDPIDLKSKTKFFYGDKVTLQCTREDATAGFNNTNVTVQTPPDTEPQFIEASTTTGGSTSEIFEAVFKDTKNLGEYLVFCSVTDKAGNVNATANFTFDVVAKPPSGGSPFQNGEFKSPVASIIIGKGSKTNVGVLTEVGLSRLMSSQATAVMSVHDVEHSFAIKEIALNTVTYTVDDNFDLIVAVEETKTVDLNADGTDDISVELHQLFKKKADTTFKLISLKAGPTVPTTGSDGAGDTIQRDPITPSGEESSPWFTIILVVIVLVLVIFAGLHFMAGKGRGGARPVGGHGQSVSFNKKDLGAYRQQGNANMRSRHF